MGILAIRKSFDNNKGVTIIEVLIVIAICGILAAISTGPLLRWRANKFVEENANYLISDIERAKIEAIRRNTNIRIAFFNDDGSTSTGSFTQYQVGRIVGAGGVGDDVVLWERSFATRLAASTDTSTLVFTPRGIIQGPTGTFVFSDTRRADLKRRVTVSRLSLVTSSTTN